MNIVLSRESLIKPLMLVLGAVEKRQTLPILSHVLLSFKKDRLWLTATDLELELVGSVILDNNQDEFDITVPARKLLDICRSLPDEAEISCSFEQNKLLLKSGRSRFTLSTLPATDFPKVSPGKVISSFSIPQSHFKQLLEMSHFAMAQQDVRYYLNGMLFDIQKSLLQTVATDGHRLALSNFGENFTTNQPTQVIVPRKAILELIRLLVDSDDAVQIAISTNHFHANTNDFAFTSKLMDGKFPDFNRVIPKNTPQLLEVNRDIFKQALNRVAILCNEKYHSIRITVDTNCMLIVANNPEQEEAEDEIEASYTGDKVEIGFNVNYLLDVLNVLPAGNIKLCFNDGNSSVLIQHATNHDSLYVVMPMRL